MNRRTWLWYVTAFALVAAGAWGGWRAFADTRTAAQVAECCPPGCCPDCWPGCCPECPPDCCPDFQKAQTFTSPLTGERLPSPDCCPLNQQEVKKADCPACPCCP
jgi:hypothetical protein